MKTIIRFFSRITVRLLCFNILIVFLPVAGFLYLNIYETQLVKSQEDSMAQQGRLVSAALSEGMHLSSYSIDRFWKASNAILSNLKSRSESRIRIVDKAGMLVADSIPASKEVIKEEDENRMSGEMALSREEWQKDPRDSLLYLIGSSVVRLYNKVFNPPTPGLEPQIYSKKAPFRGTEIQLALSGKYGATTRISAGGQRSMTLYVALPIWNGEEVAGAALVSQSTYKILNNLYELRLNIFKIFAASVCAAILLSIFLSFTIGRPLKKLTLEAGAIVDHRGRMTRRFSPLKRHDEVGDLSCSLARLTERLESHIAFIEAFAGDISHEFKNPLASIRSHAELALGSVSEKEREGFLGKILEDTSRMEMLISGVREISRIDARLLEEETGPVDLTVLLGNLVSSYSQKHNRPSFTLEARDSVMVKASHYRLSEIFENLIDNAASFTPAGGAITIKADRYDHRATVVIRDSGPGIPEEHLDKIFLRFFSYRPSEDGKKEHTGLGLAIVKAIAEGYGGSVTAANLKTGGAQFTVTLPAI